MGNEKQLPVDNEYVIMRSRRTEMYTALFYYDKNGNSEIVDYLDALKVSGMTSKTARINRTKILAYIGALEQHGTRIGMPIVRHIDGDIWDLRPLANRIFFFYWRNDKFVLLHHYTKKSQKTPPGEIERARAEVKDYRERHGE
ncbi:MAG: type II toxin-antitoxin system RelE/ParE family toxin [Coriobacteriales bacterium]|jgi:phage-related protein|nr:type II toxin-antitoxin system RelE/ParE family toxin [Coriobacteriales bacterium]